MTIKGKLKTKDEPIAKGKIEVKQDATNNRKAKGKGKKVEKERPNGKNTLTAGAVEVDKPGANRRLEVKKHAIGKLRPIGQKRPIGRGSLEGRRVPENKRDLAAGDRASDKGRRGPRGINVGQSIGLRVHVQENPRGCLKIHESGLILS